MTRFAHANNISWICATAYQCDPGGGWDAERLAKMQHNGPRFCSICSGGEPRAPKDAIQIPFTYRKDF